MIFSYNAVGVDNFDKLFYSSRCVKRRVNTCTPMCTAKLSNLDSMIDVLMTVVASAWRSTVVSNLLLLS